MAGRTMTVEAAAALLLATGRGRMHPQNVTLCGFSNVGLDVLASRGATAAETDPMYQSFDGSHHLDMLVHGVMVHALTTTLTPGKVFEKEGYERGMALVRETIRDCDGCVYVYDVTSRASFESMVKLRAGLDDEILAARGQRARSVKIRKAALVLANKIDLPEAEWEVPHEEGRAWSESIGAPFAWTSGRTGEGLLESILKMLKQLIIINAELHIENENFLASLVSDIPKPPTAAKSPSKDSRPQRQAQTDRSTREREDRAGQDSVGSSRQAPKEVAARKGGARGMLSKLSMVFKPASGQFPKPPTACPEPSRQGGCDNRGAPSNSLASSLTTTLSSRSADPSYASTKRSGLETSSNHSDATTSHNK